ncbi:MAG: hypothetical protein H0X16_06805 [Chloroflexi bacterium]|nr:hypothetical protein [Chloroflexota bacterium]HEV8053991.1 hypothetical protein [Candidatus Limnocylindrales bacterium]
MVSSQASDLVVTNRDIAVAVWFSVAAVFAATRPGLREGVAGILRGLWGPLGAMLVLYGCYVAAVVAVAARVGVWNVGLGKETVAWFFVPGLALLFSFSRASRERAYLARRVLSVIGLTAIIEFYVGLAVFPLVVELVLLPVVVVLSVFSAAAGFNPETRIVKVVADRLIAVVGLAVLFGTAVVLVGQWESLDKTQLARTFALPIWLTLAAAPFVYAFSLYANYEEHFIRLALNSPGKRATTRAKVALVLGYHFRNHELSKFKGPVAWNLARAETLGDARRKIAEHRRAVQEEEAREREAAARLVRFAGVTGTDEHGEQLDQREFAESKEALDRLVTFHEAQYEERVGYRPNLIELVGDLVGKKLPADPGIVMRVGRKGRAWYAWRRTVTGWCLGVGAVGPPPDAWTYQAPKPPDGFPSATATGWKRGRFAGVED